MKISVKVKPNSKLTQVEKISDAEFVVRVKEPPVEGRANEAVIRALAEHFNLPKTKVQLLRGASGKTKLFEIARG